MPPSEIAPPARKRQVGDRRRHPRFEVVGTLWGRLELVEQLPVVNVSSGGVLMLAHRPMRRDERLTMTLRVDGESREVEGQVCHVSRLSDANDRSPHYQVGISVSPSLVSEVAPS